MIAVDEVALTGPLPFCRWDSAPQDQLPDGISYPDFQRALFSLLGLISE